MTATFVLSILGGWFGHKLEPTLAASFPDQGTNRIASYGVGGLLILAAFVILTAGRMERKERETAISLLIVAMVAIGMGTTAGRIADYLRER